MSEPNVCLWCGNYYNEGMEGCCRKCWEDNQFKEEQKNGE